MDVPYDGGITYQCLDSMVDDLAAKLAAADVRPCVLYLDNGPGWVVADLALRRSGCVIVPVPIFFSAEQVEHAFRLAGVDAVMTDSSDRLSCLLPAGSLAAGVSIADDAQLRGIWLSRPRGLGAGARGRIAGGRPLQPRRGPGRDHHA